MIRFQLFGDTVNTGRASRIESTGISGTGGLPQWPNPERQVID
jgi:hypothetical protein